MEAHHAPYINTTHQHKEMDLDLGYFEVEFDTTKFYLEDLYPYYDEILSKDGWRSNTTYEDDLILINKADYLEIVAPKIHLSLHSPLSISVLCDPICPNLDQQSCILILMGIDLPGPTSDKKSLSINTLGRGKSPCPVCCKSHLLASIGVWSGFHTLLLLSSSSW